MDKQNIGTELSRTPSEQMGTAIESLISSINRTKWERRWYDNRFFDDGMHFRYVSKKTGRIIDYAGGQGGSIERAIPRASRQIRGIVNLLEAPEPTPVVYPDPVYPWNYKDNQQAYQKAYEESKRRAKRAGQWLSSIWNDYDEGLAIKFIDMLLIAAKDGIGYLQIYSPPGKEKLCFDVFDAFDLYIYGEYKDLKDLPFIIKGVPMRLSEIQSHPAFQEMDVNKIVADNKYATSEIKDAYMTARYGLKGGKGQEPTFLVKETETKEILSKSNWEQAIKLGADNGALEGKSKGDMIMRHTFSVGGVTLDDEYISASGYSYVDFRYEPGALYQTPLIERFIPQNKSLDIIMTRLEAWVNAMIVGIYQKRKSENFQLSNFPGGQLIEYETFPLTQMQNSSVGDTPFRVIDFINKFIDEQGASTSALNSLPAGVKSGVAIESVKATEYANLKIPTMMLKNSMQRVSSKIIETVDKRFVTPQLVYNTDDNGEPDYFHIIGSRGLKKRLETGADIPEGVVPIKEGAKLRIEIEPGFGLTVQGKRETMQQILTSMESFAEKGYLSKDAVSLVLKKFMDIFGFGSTQEFMDALQSEDMPMDENNLMKMKIALAEAAKEIGMVGSEHDQKLVDSAKIGTLESLKESGILDKLTQDKQAQPAQKPPNISINFKDLPPEGKSEAAALAGIPLSPQHVVSDQIRQQSMDVLSTKAKQKPGGKVAPTNV
jgi:hypothetical protein